MEKAEIVITSGGDEPHIDEQTLLEGPEAMREGYQRFKRIIEGRADFLLGATVSREDDTLTVEIRLRVGPQPFWSKEFLKARDFQYAPSSTANKTAKGITS